MNIWAKRIALLLLAVLVSLLLAEALVRWSGWGPEIFAVERGMLRLSPLPGVVYELSPGFESADGSVQINAQGMRQGPVARAADRSHQRIAVIGDSLAFGMGADPAGHFSVHLEEFLNRPEFPLTDPVEVLNFGVPGYNISQVASVLDHRVTEYQPDIVIYLYCLNDPQPYSRELAIMLRASEETASTSRFIHHSRSGRRPLWMRSRLAWLVAGLWEGPATDLPDDPGEWDDMMQLLQGTYQSYYRRLYRDPASLERLSSGLNRIAAWQRRQQIPVWIVVFPVLSDLENYAFLSEHAWLAKNVAERGLHYLDLLLVFRQGAQMSEGPLRADPLHPNRHGYRLAAHAFALALQEHIAEAPHVP